MSSSLNPRCRSALAKTILAASLGLPAAASASMGNLGTSYGLFPEDLATAQALSMFNAQVSATYYNPAALVKDERGELTRQSCTRNRN